MTSLLAGCSPRKLKPFQFLDGLIGLAEKLPPLFGHTLPSTLAVVDGDFTLKHLWQRSGRMKLKAATPNSVAGWYKSTRTAVVLATPSPEHAAALLDKGFTVVDMSDPAHWGAQFDKYDHIFGGAA